MSNKNDLQTVTNALKNTLGDQAKLSGDLFIENLNLSLKEKDLDYFSYRKKPFNSTVNKSQIDPDLFLSSEERQKRLKASRAAAMFRACAGFPVDEDIKAPAVTIGCKTVLKL